MYTKINGELYLNNGGRWYRLETVRKVFQITGGINAGDVVTVTGKNWVLQSPAKQKSLNARLKRQAAAATEEVCA